MYTSQQGWRATGPQLLQEFRDLMEANTLGEDEDCPICMDKLEVKKCKRCAVPFHLHGQPILIVPPLSSLPCQHMFCEGCISQLKPEAGGCVYDDEVDSIRCPQCRKVCRRDDVEVIEQTASEQWDALLEVAQKWAEMDVPREDDTSEEEAEEQFIDDGEEDDKAEETDTRSVPRLYRRRQVSYARSGRLPPTGPPLQTLSRLPLSKKRRLRHSIDYADGP